MVDSVSNVMVALRLAWVGDGVKTSDLAREVGITRQSAHSILVKLVRLGELERSGGIGRHGYVYKIPENIF